MPLPAPTPTKVNFVPVSSLCTTGHVANVITGVWVRVLREHFSNSANLEFNGINALGREELEQYIWAGDGQGNADATKTRIQIDSVLRYNAQDVQRRPALYVKRNTFQTQRLGIRDGFTLGPRRTPEGGIERVQGEYKARILLGSHTVFCVGGSGAEAELLGMEVFSHLVGFSQILREDLKLHRLEVTEVGEAAVLDEAVERFVVPVTVAYAAIPAWRVDVVAPWLKTLEINVVPQ
jgi:hypothetical protein